MRIVGVFSRRLNIVVLAVACALLPGIAVAKDPGGSQFDTDKGGEKTGQTLTSRVSYTESRPGNGEFTGSLTPVGDWEPPACWLEPLWTPEEYEKEFARRWNVPHFSGAGEAHAMDQDRFKNGKPYKDFNKDKTGKGMFWGTLRDESRLDDPAVFSCDQADFWADFTDPPENPNAIDPEILAQLAYNRINVPDTKVSLAPQQKQTVNLPTWAWLDKAEFEPVSVTAEINVPGLNISATTTATPVSLKIEPGTSDAKLYPASGECPVVDGRIGSPYVKGSGDQDPPCGVTYLRASPDGPYKLQATITWEITWTGTGFPDPEKLPNGTFGATQDVTVQEIQAINR